jgi:hypothetical protein
MAGSGGLDERRDHGKFIAGAGTFGRHGKLTVVRGTLTRFASDP